MHPLINPDSAAYYDAGERTAIEMLEEIATVSEQIGWCKGNIFKYTHRQAHKGQQAADRHKIKTYEAYLALLRSMGREAVYLRVFEAYRKYGIEMRYR